MASARRRRPSSSSLRAARRPAPLERAVLSFVNGLVYFAEGAARPTMGSAAKDLVFSQGKLALYRVRPLASEEYELGHGDYSVDLTPRRRTPILLVPPLMVRTYVYDLRPEHSMVRALRNAGYDVFLVDFGVPDREDEQVRLDDYVLDYVPRCVDEALRASGAEGISLVGYCMGGIFSLLHVATHDDARVRNVVTIGAPVDFEKMGLISAAARVGTWGSTPIVDRVLDRLGNVPGNLSSIGFKLLGGTATVTRYRDLFVNLHDEEYVRGFDSIDTWLKEMIPYPKEAFRQLVHEVVRGNKLLRNELSFGGRRADLERVRCPLLAFAGRTDNVAAPASTAAIVELVGSSDKQYREVSGGHIGVVGGSKAPAEVWEPTIRWLGERDAPRA